MNKAIDKYIEYANSIIEKYSQHNKIVKDGNISLLELNNALCEYLNVYTVLTIEYEKLDLEYQFEKAKFNEWYDEKWVNIRNELNPIDLPASKWVGKQEIDSTLKVRFKDEFRLYNTALIIKEKEVALLRRIVDGYKKMDSILQTLAYNYRGELKAIGLEDRANYSARSNDNDKIETPIRMPI